MPFEFIALNIPDVIVIKPKIFKDTRGFFLETYRSCEYADNGISAQFVQDNQSLSHKGVLRGLHYQTQPKAQGKLIRVIAGSIFDVAVDIRKDSPTFGKWVSKILTADAHEQLWIPVGFAHGFQVLENDTQICYKVTDIYSPEHELGIRWDDPDLQIPWPLPNPDLSEKDKSSSYLKNMEGSF